jgi:hypothetical protein
MDTTFRLRLFFGIEARISNANEAKTLWEDIEEDSFLRGHNIYIY